MANLWYENAIIYCVDVKSFMDANGDGTGDVMGLADRLDHLERLGVTCIWLNPFYPSPRRDNGYYFESPAGPMAGDEDISLSPHGYCWLRCNGERR